MTVRRVAGWLLVFLLVLAPIALAGTKDEIKGLRKSLNQVAQAGGDPTQAIGLMQQIAAVGGPEAVAEVYEVGLEVLINEAFYKAVLEQLRKMDGILAHVVARAEKANTPEGVYICDLLTGVDALEARQVLIKLVKDPHPYVQQGAVLGLQKCMHRDAIGPLIDLYAELMKQKKDHLYYLVGDALFILTGLEYDLIEEWRQWWEGPNAQHFDPKADETGRTGKVRKRREPNPAEFFGVPIESKNVCFVFDRAGSMGYIEKDDIPGLGRASGDDQHSGASGGGQMTPDDQALADFWRRISMAKRELTKVFRLLEEDCLFNVVAFSTQADLFKKKAMQATQSNKNSAIKWVEAFKPEGSTNTLDALIKAFASDPRLTTIYFLSDGTPSKDGRTDDPPEPILDKVFELNRFRKIKIHTFGFSARWFSSGEPSPQLEKSNAWLRRLSEATGGTFTEMKVDPNCTPQDPYGEKKRKKKEKEKEKEKDTTKN